MRRLLDKTHKYIPFITLSSFIALSCLIFVARKPGEWNPDSLWQYQQALSGQYSDWHPPIMAALWSVLPRLGDPGTSMFLLQILLYGVSLGIIAAAITTSTAKWRAAALFCFACTPLLLMLVICLHKDIGMADALIFAFSMTILLKKYTFNKYTSAFIIVVLSASLIYGALVRANSIFAAIPLIYFSLKKMHRPFVKQAAFYPVLAIAGLAIGGFINHTVLEAKKLHAEHSLEIFDLAGIAVITHDMSVWPDKIPYEKLAKCYSPIMWDTLYSSSPTHPDCTLVPLERVYQDNFKLGSLWLHAVTSHPLAYAEHKLLAFNSFLYFYTPLHHTEAVRHLDRHASTHEGLKDKILDWLRYGLPFTPVVWLIISATTVGSLIFKHKPLDVFETGSVYLFASGFLYLLSFFPGGVATDIRYEFWSMLAFGVSAILAFPSWRATLQKHRTYTLVWLLILIISVSAMSYARLTNDNRLLNPEYAGYHMQA